MGIEHGHVCPTFEDFVALLRWWLRSSDDTTLAGDSGFKKNFIRVQMGDVSCSLSGDTTRAGVAAVLDILERAGVVLSVTANKNGVLNRVAVGPGRQLVPGFYLYTDTDQEEPLTLVDQSDRSPAADGRQAAAPSATASDPEVGSTPELPGCASDGPDASSRARSGDDVEPDGVEIDGLERDAVSPTQDLRIEDFLASVVADGVVPAVPTFLGERWNARVDEVEALLEIFETSFVVEVLSDGVTEGGRDGVAQNHAGEDAGDGVAPYVQVRRSPEGFEVEAVSNEYLSRSGAGDGGGAGTLSPNRVSTMIEMGWTPPHEPTRPNFYRVFSRDTRLREIAWVLVLTLHDVYGARADQDWAVMPATLGPKLADHLQAKKGTTGPKHSGDPQPVAGHQTASEPPRSPSSSAAEAPVASGAPGHAPADNTAIGAAGDAAGPTGTILRGKEPAELALRMVAELHRAGHERIRIVPGMSGSGMHWRLSLVPLSELRGPRLLNLPHAGRHTAHYTTASENEVYGTETTTETTPEGLAQDVLARHPDIARLGRGPDPDYARWYRQMLDLVFECGGLPAAYGDYIDTRRDTMAVLHSATPPRAELALPPFAPPGPVLEPSTMTGFDEMTVASLLAAHSSVIATLRARGVLRTNNPPSGDYSEWLVARALDGELAPPSQSSFDVIAPDVGLIQVKARLVSNPPKPGQLQSGLFKSDGFDHAALVLLSADDYSILRAALLPVEAVKSLWTWHPYTQGHTVTMKKDVMEHPEGVDITERLRAAATAR